MNPGVFSFLVFIIFIVSALAAKIIVKDHVLADYRPESMDTRGKW